MSSARQNVGIGRGRAQPAASGNERRGDRKNSLSDILQRQAALAIGMNVMPAFGSAE